MSCFETSPTPENILDWLDNGGYSCVLYLGQHRAYVSDEDDDYGWQPIPVAIARKLLDDGLITTWDLDPSPYVAVRYRPAGWVAGWEMGQRPWYTTDQNQKILREHHDEVAQHLLASCKR